MTASLSGSYPPFVDPVIAPQQQVSYTYWPVSYAFGDPTVISNAPLPLSGVKISEVMRGVGELRATLQLADDEVRAINPWDKIIPRKTGIVAVRQVLDEISGTWVDSWMQHYIVWAAPRDPHTGRMSIMAQTVESLWARRLITKAITWTGVDQRQIAADLLNPAVWSKVALGTAMWPGWITVDPPTVNTGVTRDFSYKDGQESNLLESQQNRSQLQTNSYEWRTATRVLSGSDGVSANTFRVQFILGFPSLGRRFGDVAPVPRVRFDTNGGGNVLKIAYNYDGSQVPNNVWGRGNGYEDLQIKTLAQNPEWNNGFLQTESKFSDPDVKQLDTLTSYCFKQIWDKLGSEQFLSALTIRGDLPPYFGTYVIGDDLALETNDMTWPPDLYGSDGFIAIASRIFGWTLTPPAPDTSETVQLVITGGDI